MKEWKEGRRMEWNTDRERREGKIDIQRRKERQTEKDKESLTD